MLTSKFLLVFIVITTSYLSEGNCLPHKFMDFDSNFSNLTTIEMIDNLSPDDIFNVRCFWIKGWNVFDISNLERQEKDWNFTTGDGSSIFYNFCRNTFTECKNSTNITNPSTMVGFDKDKNCKRLSGDSEKFNTFSLLNPDNSSLGLQITFSTGEVCNDGAFFSTVFNITCDPTMERGSVELFNKDEFSMSKCKNILIGKSFENQYAIIMGAVIIVVGVFLIIFGAKFVKVTIFVVGAFSCTTIFAIVYFNIFSATSTTTVWIVLGIGLLVGIAISYFLIHVTKAFFMLIGGYMGYTLGIFLYNLLLNYIHADPKVVYWVSIIVSVLVCALLALWLIKHILILATSICGGYAIIRGASLYIGHFPNENVIIDLVQHQEWDQLEIAFDGHVYIYLGIWAVASILGIVWQYKHNSDKSNDDYKKIQ